LIAIALIFFFRIGIISPSPVTVFFL